MSLTRPETRGRPRSVADINVKSNPAQFYYDEFYKACKPMLYPEMMALARYLGIDIRTVYRWRNGESFPRTLEFMLVVLDWVRTGKPITHLTQKELRKQEACWWPDRLDNSRQV